MSKICVTIGSENPEELRRQINLAFLFRADFIEIRFDFLKLSDMEEALEIAKEAKTKAVFTLRPAEHRGRFMGSTSDRIVWLKRLHAIKPMLLDVEVDTIMENNDLANYFEEHNNPILVSWHDFEKTPNNDELADVLEQMRIYSNYVKVVTTANSIEDVFRVLDLYEYTYELNLITFAMGELGILSRILCTLYGNAPFTYAALEKAVAPGQLTIRQMRKIYDRISISRDRVHAKPS